MGAASLIAEAVAMLRDVGDASAVQLASELEDAFKHMPWRVGIRGDLAARTALFDVLTGGGLLAARKPGCAPLRVTRADRTRFVARRDQGPREEQTQPVRAWPRRAFGWLRRVVMRSPGRPDAFLTRLRELASGHGADLIEIVLYVARGPLDDDIEVIEDPLDTSQLDAVLIVKGMQLCTERTTIGDLPRAIAALPDMLALSRALTLTERAIRATMRVVAAVDAEDRAAAADFAGRVADLEDLRIEHADELARDRIERIGKQVVPSVAAVMEHAAAHLGADVAELGRQWRTAIEQVSTSSQLSDAVAKINETSAASVRQIAEDARLLVMGGIAGCVRDLFPEVAAPLRKHGLPEELARARLPAPPLPQVPVLRSLASPREMNVGSAGWFGALFRSLDSRRTDIRDKVEQQISRLEQVAVAEMRDAEPKLRAAIEAALADELAAAIERQRVWLESAIAAEHAEFALRGEAHAARTARVDAARRASQRLREQMAELAARQPHAAVASASEPDPAPL